MVMQNSSVARKDSHGLPFRIEKNFYEKATSLRSEFESRVKAAGDITAGASPLTYSYLEDVCQYLSAMGENLFSSGVLFDFLDKLRAWARPELDTNYASTPRVQVYVNGCWRGMVRDAINVRWHYMLSLTENPKYGRKLQFLADSVPNGRGFNFPVGRLISTELNFNELLVHDAATPFGIDKGRASANPLHGAVFLDGYLW